jgi:hypothetical protein
MDDDPLTSPSFPAINTSDSRSYRTRRPSSSQSPGAPASGGRETGGYGEPAQPHSPYPPAPDRSASGPNGYPVQPAAAPAAGSAYPSGPVANPYGSFVNAPRPGYSDAGTPPLDAAAYGSGYAAGRQAVAGTNWYASTPDGGQAVNGYLPSPGSPNGTSYETPLYQGGSSAQPGGYGPGGYGPGQIAGQHDQRGYGVPELTYGQDGYQGYPGYGNGGR